MLGQTMMPPCRAIDCRAGPVAGICRVDFAGDALGEPPAGRDEDRARIGIVLGLREQIGGDPRRRSRTRSTIRISVGPA